MQWIRVLYKLPENYKLVWCCFRSGKVFIGYKNRTLKNAPNKGWLNIEDREECWVNWWKEIEYPVFDIEWKDR